MNIEVQQANVRNKAFTLVEVMVGIAIFAIAFVSLYAGIGTAFSIIKLSRENLRATQVMLEKFEAIRLFTWAQLQDPDHLSASGLDYYNVKETNGLTYSNSVVVSTNFPNGAGLTYSKNLAQVSMTVTWTSSGVLRTRHMYSYVAKKGMQQYVYDTK